MIYYIFLLLSLFYYYYDTPSPPSNIYYYYERGVEMVEMRIENETVQDVYALACRTDKLPLPSEGGKIVESFGSNTLINKKVKK